MFEAAVLLSHARRLRSIGVAAALQSGGACTLFAEAAGAAGLELPAFAARTKRTLRRVLPALRLAEQPPRRHGSGSGGDRHVRGRVDGAGARSRRGGGRVRCLPAASGGRGPVGRPRPDAGRRAAEGDRRGVRERRDERARVRPGGEGVHASGTTCRSSKDITPPRGRSGRWWHGRRFAGGRWRSHRRTRTAGRALRVLRGKAGAVDEATAATVLALYGVRRPKEAVARTPQQAAASARRVGFPVAIKALAPEVPHKARLGGVRLGIGNATDVEVAAAEVLQAARRAGARTPRVLVQRMATGRGGAGGRRRRRDVRSDAHDASRRARSRSPVTRRSCRVRSARPRPRAFVEEQAARCGLDPRRHDLRATARAVAAISRAVHDLRARLHSLEANPLLVAGRGAVAVDALAEARIPALRTVSRGSRPAP